MNKKTMRGKIVFSMVLLAVAVTTSMLAFNYHYELGNVTQTVEGYKIQIEQLEKESSVKVETLKDKLVTDLAEKCETQGAKEPDSVIIFDSNNQASIGAWQWQIKSVQHYVKVFEHRDITRVEAIQIAVDHERAKALTKRVIFEDEKGVDNWHNCAVKLGLKPQIALLKKL